MQRLDIRPERDAGDGGHHRVVAAARLFDDGVGQAVDEIEIIARAARKRVRTGSTRECVGLRAADKAVIARVAEEGISARSAGDRVGEFVARKREGVGARVGQVLDIIGGSERIGGEARRLDDLDRVGATRRGFDDDVIGAVDHVEIIARAAGQCVIASPARERVVRCAADEAVIAGVAEEGVGARAAGDRVVARVARKRKRIRARVGQVLDIVGGGKRIGAEPRRIDDLDRVCAARGGFRDRVVQVVDDVEIVAGAARERVIAGAARERVVRCAADDAVIARVAEEGIGGG